MEKIEKNGKVAVLYSSGYGAGWSTWNEGHREALCMDARIVGPVLAGDARRWRHHCYIESQTSRSPNP